MRVASHETVPDATLAVLMSRRTALWMKIFI